MKAAVNSRYGGPEVVQVQQVDKPTPGNHEILIKIYATAVNSADRRLRQADPFAVRFFFGLFRPRKKILGGVLSGVVEAVGAGVDNFKPGDAVFGATALRMGAHAEYICLPDNAPLVLKPAGLTHEEAASLPFGGMTALHFLQKAHIQPGQKVLIYGASGAVGSAAVQIAKAFGAQVTGVCSARNLEMVKSLGADEVLDYRKVDFSAAGSRFDVVYETVNQASFSACLAALKPGGVLLLGAAMAGNMLKGAWATAFGNKKVISGVSSETVESVAQLALLAEEGRIKAAIDRVFSLERIAEAHAYVDLGHKSGNVVIA